MGQYFMGELLGMGSQGNLLITLLVYSFALHGSSFKAFRKPALFHVYTIVAFLSVLITYFGVNMILGGIHSYM